MFRSFSFEALKQTLIAAAVIGGTATIGCMVDDDGAQGAAGTGGTGGSGTGGGAGTGGGTVSECPDDRMPQACAGTLAPAWGDPPGDAPGLLIDWTTYSSSGTWGASSSGQLTGGTAFYQGESDVQLTVAVDAGSLRITGTVTPMGYAGLVFWFGPCVDASAFTGLTFAVGGALNGAVMKAQVQTHDDYPIDVANTKGGCMYTDCANRFTECAGPTMQLVVPASPETQDLPWSSFTGGTPVADVTPAGLVGLQFQFECQADVDCAVDVTLGTISFSTTAAGN
jgi:hypothetical protein